MEQEKLMTLEEVRNNPIIQAEVYAAWDPPHVADDFAAEEDFPYCTHTHLRS
jgi:hypothetical protein